MDIGFLGGGQLARMLAQSAFRQGHQAHVYSESPDDPAAQVTRFWHKGHLEDKTSLKKFLKSIDVLCFEHEFANIPLLLKSNKSIKTQIYPDPLLIEKLQDRWEQKKQLVKYKLSTAPFVSVSNLKEANDAFELFGHMVLKARRFGYDGYGTFYVKTKQDIFSLKKALSSSQCGFIAEPYCHFKQELALIAARNLKGEIVFLPLVQTHQKNSKCLWVKGPVKNISVNPLKQKIKKYLSDTNYIGVIAFELFDLGAKKQNPHRLSQILVNEVAPRVHNSGHYSINALDEDQFSLHLKCLSGASIKAPKLLSDGFAMHNLIGSGKQRPVQFSQSSHFWLHWYGKNKNTLGRKMGHINCVDSNPNKALKKTLSLIEEFKL